MSKSHSESKVRLNASAPEPTTEIFVVDSRFRRVASGLGDLQTDLDPGIYKVRFRSGSEQRDELVEVTAERSPVNVTTEPLGFSSAAPIVNTRTTREHHRYPAENESHKVHLHKGNGSQLYLFARDLLEQPVQAPWVGVSLHDIEGNQIAELHEGMCDETHSFAALNLELDPGTYRLRVDSSPLGNFEMFLITSDGWQTQVFLSAADFQAGDMTTRRAALKTAAVFMARNGYGFHPDGKHVRLAELARQGLATGRNVIRGTDLNQLLRGKFDNPMLGIYGAHLLLLSRRQNHELIDIVTANLRDLVGSHTDVEALMLRSSRHSKRPKDFEFPAPPMLRSSWELIVKDSLKRKATVPEDSITQRLADGLLSTTPWLLYRMPEVQVEEGMDIKVNIAQTQRVLGRLVVFGGGEGREMLKKVSRDRSAFTPLEQKIITATLDAGELNEYSSEVVKKGEKNGTVTVAQIFRNLDAPSVSIARSTMNLVDKLGLTALKE